MVVNYRDQTMGIYYLIDDWLVQQLHLRPILKEHVRHRQHITAYPRACLVRGHVIVVGSYRDQTMVYTTQHLLHLLVLNNTVFDHH